jgi:pimeloyl-ACP methyl ester carboxylesterase
MDLKQIRDEPRAHGPQEAPKRSKLRVALWLLVALLALPVLVLGGFRTAAGLREVSIAAELAPARGQFVPTRSGRLFLQQKGPSTGIPVVLIHGTGAWSELWRPTIDHLAGLGFRVTALDMPPFGFSDRPEPPDYSRRAQAERIADVLAGLGIQGAYLVGHSFGAGPTVETVLRFPDRVRGLVLVAGALAISDGGGADPSGLAAWVLDQSWLRNSLMAATGTNPLLTRRLLAMMIHRKETADAQAVAVLQKPMTLRKSTRDLGVWLKGFLSADRAALSADRGRYADIKVITTLVWGDQDTLTPLAQGRDINGLIAGSNLIVMPGIGHIPQLEAPAGFAAILGETLLKMAR